MNKFYITTAISYPNGKPHIGHAYEALATDTIARFKSMDGFDVMFLTGTDEHGIKMLQTAKKLDMSAKDLADTNTPEFITMLEAINSSHNDFVRTTEKRHHEACINIWNKMFDNGDIYIDKYSGWYSIRDEAYYEENETVLNKNKERISPQGTVVTWVEEETYFFKLSKYQDKLIHYYENNIDFIQPETRRNEVLSFVKRGLKDLSISRTTFDWGIKVPNDPDHVMYVWVDALTNYLTGIGYPSNSEEFNKYWPADIHIIGKDILRFHAVFWPAFLMSAKLDLPEKVFAHGFLFNRGEKMSKSSGNVISPIDLIEKFGTDQIRYFFMREVPFGSDGNYSDDTIIKRINADLANDLGNLVQRSLSMISKNNDNLIPETSSYSDEDKSLNISIDELYAEIKEEFNRLALHKILSLIWVRISDLNKYFASQKPWELKTTDKIRMNTVLYITAENIRKITLLIKPFMPDSSDLILNQLGVPEENREFVHLNDKYKLNPGDRIGELKPVFPKYISEKLDG
ncbi:MAG: methionine--tRNA ligase [Alphaproteobacteria bacterium]|jgi:methionyl-tRNA synthetase|tara:strand:- start:40420 stop:41964 length:1545 start_codon:yes stop_codon:yes gene_type:complete